MSNLPPLSPGASLKVVSFFVLQRFWVSFMKIDPDQDEVRKSITCLEMALLHCSPSTPKAVAVTLSKNSLLKQPQQSHHAVSSKALASTQSYYYFYYFKRQDWKLFLTYLHELSY